jgi:hypothetical protein
MVTDSLDPAGIYFGTRSGKVYASRDAGKSRKELLDGLTQIVCVASAVVAELAGSSPPKATEKHRQVPPKNAKRGVAKRKSARATRRKRSRR